MMHRHHMLTALAALACACVLLLPSHGVAQNWLESFRLDRFDPAPALNDGLALSLPSTLGHLVPSVQLVGDYAAKPLTSRPYGADRGDVEIVSGRMSLNALVALGLGERFEVFARVPVTVYQTGEEPTPGGRQFRAVDKAGMSDVALGGSVRLLGKLDRGPQLGLNAGLSLPSGSERTLSTDGGVGARGTLSFAQVWNAATLAFESGIAYRPERQYGFAELGTEFVYRAGVHVPAGQRVKVLVELNGATTLNQFFEEDARPLEALGALRAHLGKGVYGTFGGGLGLLGAPGLPLGRGVLGIGWMPTQEERRAPERPIEAPVEESAPHPANLDTDRDGVDDAADKCIDQAEDHDGFEDSDGCPEVDNDRDGIEDARDVCPRAAEDLDGDDDEDGCPEASVQADPSAPTEAEIAQVEGAPAPPNVHFEQDHAEVRGQTRQDLRAGLAWFVKHPGSYRLVLQGHASSEGSAEYNELLARQRAEAAARYLRKHDVWLRQHDVRLDVVAEGKGARFPIADNDTDEGRARNRRVEFKLEER